MMQNMLIVVLGFLATAGVLTPMVPASSIEPTRETQDRIDNICRSNEDYGFCNKVFHYNLPYPDTDYVGLARITIVEARKNATGTLDFIREQIPGEENPSELDYFQVCEGAYIILKDRFDQAYFDFVKGDYTKMIAEEWDTPRVQASCSTVFNNASPYVYNLLNEMNREMRILITMSVITATYIAF